MRTTNLVYPYGTSAWFDAGTQVLPYYTEGMQYEEMTDVIGSRGANHNCSHTKTTVVGGLREEFISYSWIGGNTFYEAYGLVPVSSSKTLMDLASFSPIPAGLQSLAVTRVPALCRADMSGLITLAEMRETVESGGVGLCSAIAKLAAAAYRGKPTLRQKRALKKALLGESGFKGFLSHLIGAELEWKFGWKPFIKDLTGAVNCMARAQKLRKRLERGYRVYGTSRTTLCSALQQNVVDGSMPLFSSSVNSEKTENIRCTASIMRRIKSANRGPDWQLMLPLYTEMMGLNPTLSKVWDLVPLSFVVDWIYPVGDMIESLEGMTTPQSNWIESYDGLETVDHRMVIRGDRTNVMKPSQIAGRTVCGTNVVEKSRYVRTQSSLTGATVPYIPPIQWSAMTPGKWFTGAELLVQRLLR